MNTDLFNANNILSTEDSLFGFDENEGTDTPEGIDLENPDETEEKTPSTEVQFTSDSLFGDDETEEEEEETDEEEPESVGEGKNKAKEEAKPEDFGSSPKGYNPYSSFAEALHGDGLFKSLDDTAVKQIKDADSFYEAMENEISSRVDEETRRVKNALDAGIEPSTIRFYEKTLGQLDEIDENILSEDSQRGKNLRRIILRQDYITKGFTEDRADREVKRILESPTDIEDAKDALQSVRGFYEDKYNSLIEKGKEEARERQNKTKREAAEFKKTVLEKENILGDIPLDKPTRQKAYDYMTKVVRTSEDGEQLTAVQLYADEHPVEFRTILGVVAALTDGFTKPGNLLNKTVDKKVRSNLAQIEARIRGSQSRGGKISFAEGDEDEPEETPRRRFRLDS